MNNRIALSTNILSQLGRWTHRRLLSAVRGPAGAGGRKRHPGPSVVGEEDETAKEEHAAGEGQLPKWQVVFRCDL